MELKGKKVTVIGMGNSGLNAAVLLKNVGSSVRVTDAHDTPSIQSAADVLKGKDIDVETGGHTENFIKASDLVVASPGVEDTSPAIRWAEEARIPIIGELELGYRHCNGRIIAITGTNGKSTVTTLTGQILKDAGLDVVLCGNIGNSLCGEIGRITKDTWVVAEVSSFQLERIEKFKPYIALILNITDDHMDRYKKFEDYYNYKLNIFRNQDKGDILILNYDAANLRDLKHKAKSTTLFYSRRERTNGVLRRCSGRRPELLSRDGAYVKESSICCICDGKEHIICRTSDILLKGLHNLENVLASSLAGVIAGVEARCVRDTIKAFSALEHRFETIDVVDGVEYIDDSKGTTVDSTYRALEACDRPVVLIAGGKDKKSDYAYVKDIVRSKVKGLVLIGAAAEAIKKALQDVVSTHVAKDMNDAVKMASVLAESRCAVLLSPMCSSFDMFRDYRHRGEAFREAVGKLRRS